MKDKFDKDIINADLILRKRRYGSTKIKPDINILKNEICDLAGISNNNKTSYYFTRMQMIELLIVFKRLIQIVEDRK